MYALRRRCIVTACCICLVFLVCVWCQGWTLGIRWPVRGSSLSPAALPLSAVLSPQLSGVLVSGWGLWESPFHNDNMSVGIVVVQVLFRQLYWWGVMSVTSLSFLFCTHVCMYVHAHMYNHIHHRLNLYSAENMWFIQQTCNQHYTKQKNETFPLKVGIRYDICSDLFYPV